MSLLTTVDRVFVKRTRRGQVKTHVRQQYLRDDLPTGSPHIDGPELEPRLSATATRYLLLDTNVVLHQIDLLERPTLCDVIITQTVLDEVRHNKISVHKRLRALITDGTPQRPNPGRADFARDRSPHATVLQASLPLTRVRLALDREAKVPRLLERVPPRHVRAAPVRREPQRPP